MQTTPIHNAQMCTHKRPPFSSDLGHVMFSWAVKPLPPPSLKSNPNHSRHKACRSAFSHKHTSPHSCTLSLSLSPSLSTLKPYNGKTTWFQLHSSAVVWREIIVLMTFRKINEGADLTGAEKTMHKWKMENLIKHTHTQTLKPIELLTI